ncbi:TraX family protein [Serratia marcescens]|uniref:TraX family protein n=1 Tax=Serratia marcescens TaxID=615 RepID=UPI0011F2EA25|nr:TraX family protein [Serratia marcescens]
MRTITLLAAGRLDFTSLQQDGIKLLALLLMMGDHANAALHLNSDALMWLGRGAFPLFALVWGYNLAQRPVNQRQATRLWLWALVTQPVYWQAVAPDGGVLDDMNILFLFAVMTQYLCLFERFHAKGGLGWMVLGGALLAIWVNHFAAGTFGWAGVFVMAASYQCYAPADEARRQGWLTEYRPVVVLTWCACVLLLNLGGGTIPMVAGLLVSAIVLLVSIALRPLGTLRERRLLPRQFFPVAYVVHLALLWALSAGVTWSA